MTPATFSDSVERFFFFKYVFIKSARLVMWLELKKGKSRPGGVCAEKFTVFAQAVGDGAVFTDVSVVVEGDQGAISTSESIFNDRMSPTSKKF